MALIYLSSTYEDLKDYRCAVYEALRKSGHQVIAMEDYVATDQRPIDKCLKDLEEADIYVGIFAFRYGYIPPVHHNNSLRLSITELEYQCAESCKKPCLVFLAKDSMAWPRVFDDAYGAEDKGEHIKALRQYFLTEKTTSQFSTPYELSTLVLAAITKHLAERKQPEPTKRRGAESATTITWDIEKQGSPYPGLMHFTQKYAPVFFGRELAVGEIVDRLRDPGGRFIIISGDSGVGKSSMVDAGVLPALGKGGLPDAQPCCSVRMVPSQRQQPWETLLGVLGSLVTQAGLNPDTLLEKLTQAPGTLGAQITTIMKASASSRALVLFMDQMEELFTAYDVTQANRFLAALYQATTEQALWVISTIRSDHLHYCHRHPDMRKVLNAKGHYALGPVERYMMQDMILKPAHAAGLTISETFAKRLINDTEAESANLPVLAFVLDRLFEERTDHVLSETVYDKLGGVTGAIGAHVQQVEAAIDGQFSNKADKVLPNLFHFLAKVQKEEGLPTRNRPKKTDFDAYLHPVIDRLVTERLLRTEGEGEEATISISHEKLFEAWPALREYVRIHKKALVDRTLLESRANKWATTGKPWLSGLATGREYHDFQQAGINARGLTKEFLQASLRARQFWIGAGLVVLLLIDGTTWLWLKGYNVEQAVLKMRSVVGSIHKEPQMVPIPGGTFLRGDLEKFKIQSSSPVREVRIKRFALGIYEVSFEEYDRFAIDTGRNLADDREWGRGRRPVINVSWEDAKAYAEWLSNKTGRHFRLPSESEWEYAARSGGKEERWAGTSDERQLVDYAVYEVTRPEMVGSKKPNGLGLYDLSGNVGEWVEDCAHDSYDNAPQDGSAWLNTDGGDCGMRQLRGGSWGDKSAALRASYRDRSDQGYQVYNLGFRLAEDLQ